MHSSLPKGSRPSRDSNDEPNDKFGNSYYSSIEQELCRSSDIWSPGPALGDRPPLDDELLPMQIPEAIPLSNQVGTRSYAIRQLVGPKDQDRIS